jgi:exodeoxyribonuclease V beta subunit
VVGGGTKLLTSPAGDDWLCLLEALEQPHRSGRVRAAALTPFLGRTLVGLDAGGEALTDELSDRLRGWALLLRGRGVAALFEAAEEQGLTARVLAQVGGERLLTDLRHVAQTLHETALHQSLGLTGLLEWLRSEREAGSQERVRRLDSDAAAVQITTVHQSKGLQYPVVHLPFVAMSYVRAVEVARYHDESGNRMLDVAGGGATWGAHAGTHLHEEAGEELRDLYVALTRAQSQVVTWWAPTANTRHGGLHRILFGRQPGQPDVPDEQDVRDDDYAARVLEMLGELGGPEPEPSEIADQLPESAPSLPVPMAARVFEREVDTEWRRTSYSGLIRVQEQPHGVSSEPEVSPKDDELDDDEIATVITHAEQGIPSPMASLPSGAEFGSLVHGVLEVTDPEAPDLHAELVGHIREQLQWWPVGVAPDELAEALLPSQLTPLGATASHARLVDIPLRDRLCELDFEFPLTGGDRPGGDGPGIPRHDTHLRDLAPLLATHLTPGDPLASYADQLTGPLGDQSLRGYLSGSIDAVLRVPAPGHPQAHRYVVVDYKTNLLGETGVPVTSADYGHAEMAVAMLHSHYPLQALLYSVVLHRYLRWRLPSYSPGHHLGGVLYLFLRGMCGPETPVVDGHVAGVFDWSPPAALVVALSDALGGSR